MTSIAHLIAIAITWTHMLGLERYAAQGVAVEAGREYAQLPHSRRPRVSAHARIGDRRYLIIDIAKSLD